MEQVQKALGARSRKEMRGDVKYLKRQHSNTGPDPQTSGLKRARIVDTEPLVLMVLDVMEEAGGRFNVWGKTNGGQSVLVRINDFMPYFYMAQPTHADTEAGPNSQAAPFDQAACKHMQQAVNRYMSPDCHVQKIEAVHKTPIMFYRPDEPAGGAYIQFFFKPGTNVKKAAASISSIANKNALRPHNLLWQDKAQFEHEVGLLQRFLVDAPVSGGAWMHLPPQQELEPGYTRVPNGERQSECDVEVTAPWRQLQCLTPDATQLALGREWSPSPYKVLGEDKISEEWSAALEVARQGQIAKLSMLTVDIIMAPKDGVDRVPVPSKDPVVCIANSLYSSDDIASQRSAPAKNGPDDGAFEEDGMEAEGPEIVDLTATEAHTPQVPVPSAREGGASVFTWSPEARPHRWLREADPDILNVFQVRDTLGALAERFTALKLNNGGLHLSRLHRMHSKAMALKRIVQYSPAWVKSQNRMASTSNQETFRVENVEGRVVLDVLRHVLTACNLASFSLVDCCQSLLSRRLEVLPPSVIARLSSCSSPVKSAGEQATDRSRLASYAADRVGVVRGLLQRLATLPEAIEIGRVTGLTLGQVLYNAQMIRTWSLLLRNAQRLGYIVSGRQDALPLSESPYLMHPVETKNVGLYQSPVAILDFASLYPSLYRAYNLCYTTLLHPDDSNAFPPEQVTVTPTGDVYVKPEIRKGILPSILAALINARAATRAALKEVTTPAQMAVLDSRQKALKLTANALYGFTGAQASPLQCVPLADSCLALGAQSCRNAIELLTGAFQEGVFGTMDAKVIYGQTDSLFINFKSSSTAEAMKLGRAAAKYVSSNFPEHMELKFEKVAQPFMLLHVNRYAGRAFESEAEVQEGKGVLMVKGLKSMWRQAPPIVRNTLQGVLARIIMQEDMTGAVEYAEGQIRRLLSGQVELWELPLTGGLWRVTGAQVAQAAAADGAPGAASAVSEEEVRGPHASLAVRLQQRDPGRTFVLGERLSYVLLPGARTQDDAAEDPLAAAKAGCSADYELYWQNKLRKPLAEILATCLSMSQIQEVLNGPHTRVRVDTVAAAQVSPAGKKSKGGRQMGLASFYRGTVKCLGCRRPVHSIGSSAEDGPALCEDCAVEDGVREGVFLELLGEQRRLEQRNCTANALCMDCHSGGLTGKVLCENGECPVLYARLSTAAKLNSLDHSFRRLDW
ncbi:hypothetical protein WJX75_002409 [Coccomyxa subellipsoidea]|uniref:DNA-directed DNA polymerase n=1 Tax=Coccomyxa subellipsoidea TaxID=248742 RepID=A0ABR2YX02_9CHLO